MKAIAKDPADRFATAALLADELRRFVENRPILSHPISLAERSWRWCKRNPWLAAANVAAVVLTLVLAIGSTIAAWIYRDQRDEIGRSLVQTQQAERQARLAQGQSLVSEGAALQRTGLIGQRFDSLDRLRRAAQILGAEPEGQKRLPEIRKHAIAALGLTDLRVRWQHDGNVFMNVDATLERYAGMDWSGAVVVRRLDDDRELLRLPAPDQRDFWGANLAFSPDGELLVIHYCGSEVDRLRIWHVEERKLLGSLEERRGDPLPRFHPDGRRLLFQAPEGGIAIWDRVERRVVRRLPLDFVPHHLSLDPDGRRLAVNVVDEAAPRVMILELETGRVLADWRSQVGIGALAWSADGQLLAVGGRDGRVYIWNVRRGRRRRCFRDTPTLSRAPSSRTRVTCWRPQAGMAEPGSGTRPRGISW